MRKLATTLIFLVLAFLPSLAQQCRLFTQDDGLSSVKINQVYSDVTGVLWVATEGGLNRYDGAKIVTYTADDADSLAIRHNMVRNVIDYDRGHLLVATHLGIQLMDKTKGTFGPIASTPDGQTYGNFNNFLKLHDGSIWASGNALVKVVVENGAVRLEKLDVPLQTELTERVYEDSCCNIWLTKFGDGIFRLNKYGKVSQYLNFGNDSNVRTLCEAKDGTVLVGTASNSLYRFDVLADRFVRINLPAFRDVLVTSMYALENGDVLVGTDGNGLFRYTPSTNEAVPYLLDSPSFRSSKIKVHSIIQDSSGNLWFGLYQKGLCFLPDDNTAFQFIGKSSAVANVIGDCCVTALHFDRSGNLLVGTDHDGIYIVGNKHSRVRHIDANPSAGLAPKVVVGLYEDRGGMLWFGSYNGGFGWLDTALGRCLYLDREKSVYSFAEDKYGRVWMGSMGDGLMYYDKHTGALVRDEDINSIVCQWINDLYISRNNVLYVATFDGLYIYDLSSRSVTIPRLYLKGKLSRCLAEDSKGNISIGTSNGLYIFDRTAISFTCINEDNGLSSESIMALQYDAEDNLWLSTGNGLSKINARTGEISNFYTEDGVLAGEFSQCTACSSPLGTMFFGGSQGVSYFNPKDTEKQKRTWPVRVSGIYINGEAVESGRISGMEPVYEGLVFDAEEFRFSYSERSFSVELAAEEFGPPASLRYVYRIDDGEEEVLPRASNTISIKDLSAGGHKLYFWSEVSGAKSDVSTVDLTVAMPWWFSNYANFTYLFLLLLIVGGLAYLNHKQSMYKAQQEDIARQKEIAYAREQFFTNISHEIRAPMSLIISPLKTLMDTDDDEARQQSYSCIYRNSNRILQLVNQLMDVRKIESGQMKLTFCPTMIVNVLDSIFELFKPQAAAKNIALNFDHGKCGNLVLWVDPSSIDKIFVNLLSNAIKYTPEGGKVQVTLTSDESVARICVSDTGMGIAKEDLPKVFQRFFQSEATKGIVGSGIGLNLAQSLAEMHKGTITVESAGVGKGSTFTVELPVGCAHISEEDKSMMTVISGPAQAVEDTPAMPAEQARKKAHRHILVVDDDNEIISFLGNQLGNDYELQTASNGKEALERIFEKVPDLVITDLSMPVMSGTELCRKIRSNINFNHIPIVVLSGNVSDADRIRSLSSGADAFMAKPFNLELLRVQIDTLIASREKLKVTFSDNQVKQEVVKPATNMLAPDEKLMERVMKVFNDNISNEKLTVDMLATEVGLSRVHLYRKLKELTNQSPQDFIRNARLMRAAAMFAEKKHSISEVAYSVGFSSPANFATAFKQLFGMSPSEYIEQHRK